jgi:hypothetical protein
MPESGVGAGPNEPNANYSIFHSCPPELRERYKRVPVIDLILV